MAASRQHKKATFLANISTIWAFERNQPRKKSRVIIMPPASLSPLSLPARKKSRFGGRGKMSSISVVHTLGDLSLTHSAGSEEEDQQRSKKRPRARKEGRANRKTACKNLKGGSGRAFASSPCWKPSFLPLSALSSQMHKVVRSSGSGRVQTA